MTKFLKLAALCATATVALAGPALGQTRVDDDRLNAAQTRFDREVATYRAEVQRYKTLRQDRRGYNNQGGYQQGYSQQSYNDDYRDDPSYDASRYYRDGDNYQERTLANEDRVYRGNDGRYYCKRNDGTTGLVLGAASGGILGNVIDGGRSRAVGTLLGAAAGAIAGRAIDRNQQQVRCR